MSTEIAVSPQIVQEYADKINALADKIDPKYRCDILEHGNSGEAQCAMFDVLNRLQTFGQYADHLSHVTSGFMHRVAEYYAETDEEVAAEFNQE